MTTPSGQQGEKPVQENDDPKNLPQTSFQSFIRSIITLALILGSVLLIQKLALKPYKIPSESMVSTLLVGDRILANRLPMHYRDPKVGEVMVFYAPISTLNGTCLSGPNTEDDNPTAPCIESTPELSKVSYIKRVLAGPGDRLKFVKGRVYRNGKLLEEKYAESCIGFGCDYPDEITIPKDHYYMVGDNRSFSNDSRFWGSVPREAFIGKAIVKYWPPNRVGGL